MIFSIRKPAPESVFPLLPGSVGHLMVGGQGVGVLGAQDPFADGQQRSELVAGPAASPASPVQSARLWRVCRVWGCSGPRTRSRMGSGETGLISSEGSGRGRGQMPDGCQTVLVSR